jgi:hypothetical protein
LQSAKNLEDQDADDDDDDDDDGHPSFTNNMMYLPVCDEL